MWSNFQRLNMLYIDAPVGSGFSYSNSLEGYYSDDQKTVANLYNFLQKVWHKGFLIVYLLIKIIDRKLLYELLIITQDNIYVVQQFTYIYRAQ